MKTKLLFLVFSLVIGTSVLSACQNPGYVEGNTPHVLSEGRQFSDISSPRNATFRKDLSYYTVQPDYRIARIVYRTPEDLEDVRTFYEETMGETGWSLSPNRRIGPDDIRFVKEQEEAVVELREQGDDTRIQIDISQRPRSEINQ